MDFIKLWIETALYPAMALLKGNRTRAYIKELKRTQNASPERLKELRDTRLRALLLHCIDHVPAYRPQADLRDEIQRDPQAALPRFPILTRAAFKADPDSFLADNIDPAARIANRTGGSTTGEPIKFFMDRVTVEHYEAARWRGLSWWGVTPGSRSVMLWGNPLDLAESQRVSYIRREKLMKNRVVLSAFDIRESDMPKHVAFLNSYRPEYIYGYATPLNAFAAILLKLGLSLSFTPKIVLSTSETLLPHYKENLEAAFGCPVVNEYGARDGGIIAFTAPCGKLHVNVENAVFETVDLAAGCGVSPGESGAVVVTDFFNYVQPRVRYLLGDMAAISDQPCGCGSVLPVMERLDGRLDDMFVGPDGKLFWSWIFTQLARTWAPDSIAEFQVIQYSPTRAELKIVAVPGGPSEPLEKFITESKAVLPDSDFAISIVDEIPKTASGKTRYAVRKFDLEGL
ncbi:adenylyltransferase [Clostridia bacterium]|nr:adenylyltransferase [Clostridia bacterium]